jgi:predicted ABC-type ATPase
MKGQRWINNPSKLCPPPTDKEVNEYVNIIYKAITKGKPHATTQAPQLIMTIGGPGAGKSTIMEILIKHHSDVKYNNYVSFDSDKLLDYLPIGDKIKNIPDINGKKTGIGYALGWKECNKILQNTNLIPTIINKLLKSNYNLILNIHNYTFLIDAQLNGYFCILVYVIVSKTTAIERVRNRSKELGRFFSISSKYVYGWSDPIDRMLTTYREKAIWYSLWADRFVVVNNNHKKKLPEKENFKIIIPHPLLHKNGEMKSNYWKLHIKKIYNIVFSLGG